MPEDRRLAAIMFTDIVGYTALMGSDEDKADRYAICALKYIYITSGAICDFWVEIFKP